MLTRSKQKLNVNVSKKALQYPNVLIGMLHIWYSPSCYYRSIRFTEHHPLIDLREKKTNSALENKQNSRFRTWFGHMNLHSRKQTATWLEWHHNDLTHVKHIWKVGASSPFKLQGTNASSGMWSWSRNSSFECGCMSTPSSSVATWPVLVISIANHPVEDLFEFLLTSANRNPRLVPCLINLS